MNYFSLLIGLPGFWAICLKTQRPHCNFTQPYISNHKNKMQYGIRIPFLLLTVLYVYIHCIFTVALFTHYRATVCTGQCSTVKTVKTIVLYCLLSCLVIVIVLCSSVVAVARWKGRWITDQKAIPPFPTCFQARPMSKDLNPQLLRYKLRCM